MSIVLKLFIFYIFFHHGMLNIFDFDIKHFIV